MLFCRSCKLPHGADGSPLFEGASIDKNRRFNPLSQARRLTGAHHKDAAAVSRTALEVALIASLQEAYFAGIKEGVLLAYSQDYKEGEPMDKLGIHPDELELELRSKYNDLLEKKKSRGDMEKQASEDLDLELEAVRAKLQELAQAKNDSVVS
jgi:hypothetical protein